MSGFTAFLFTNRNEQETVRKIAKEFNLSTSSSVYGVDPYIEVPHLFEDSGIFLVFGNNDLGREFTTLDEVINNIKEEFKKEVMEVRKWQAQEGYQSKVENFKSSERKIMEKLMCLESSISSWEEQEPIYNSKNYLDIQRELTNLQEQEDIYFIKSIDYNQEYWEKWMEREMNDLKYFQTHTYPEIKKFLQVVVNECSSLSIVSHWSDHSEKECIPILEEREVKFVDMTAETFAFLPYNTVLKIVK